MIAIESTDFNNLHPLPSKKAKSAIGGYGAHSPADGSFAVWRRSPSGGL